jgi:hypothetical protein
LGETFLRGATGVVAGGSEKPIATTPGRRRRGAVAHTPWRQNSKERTRTHETALAGILKAKQSRRLRLLDLQTQSFLSLQGYAS